MRYAFAILATLALAATLAAQTPATTAAQRGVFVEDIDKNVSACTDFYQYANGAWRAANPIPASMQRWSRRWAAGEQNKEQLRLIAEDEAKRHDWPKGSIDQQIADFYGSCMDEARINAAGMKPIKPYLDSIDSINSKAALQKTIADLHNLEVYAPFGVTSSQDPHKPTFVFLRIFAAGLGLPDRDYYLKPDQRFAEARTKYREHVTKMFELAGYSPAAAKKASDSVFAFETKLAKSHLDNIELRDPHATDHKVTFAALEKMAPHFNWTRYFEREGIAKQDLNVDQPKFLATFDEAVQSTPLDAWKTYLKWNVINNSAQALSDPFVNEDFAFYGKYLRGAKEMKPRWKRCVESEDALLGEALGQRYVERYFPSRCESADAGDGEEPPRLDGRNDSRARLDVG